MSMRYALAIAVCICLAVLSCGRSGSDPEETTFPLQRPVTLAGLNVLHPLTEADRFSFPAFINRVNQGERLQDGLSAFSEEQKRFMLLEMLAYSAETPQTLVIEAPQVAVNERGSFKQDLVRHGGLEILEEHAGHSYYALVLGRSNGNKPDAGELAQSGIAILDRLGEKIRLITNGIDVINPL
ncbi:hypothetical protein IT575_06810 [bacterium]|nr:hypothetical protein [bacterium]